MIRRLGFLGRAFLNLLLFFLTPCADTLSSMPQSTAALLIQQYEAAITDAEALALHIAQENWETPSSRSSSATYASDTNDSPMSCALPSSPRSDEEGVMRCRRGYRIRPVKSNPARSPAHGLDIL